jgi:hypothetical protein
MSVAYFPNRSIDENTEIVRKQHVGFRNYDAGKGEFLVSLRHENRYGTLILLDMGTFASCVPISTRRRKPSAPLLRQFTSEPQVSIGVSARVPHSAQEPSYTRMLGYLNRYLKTIATSLARLPMVQ